MNRGHALQSGHRAAIAYVGKHAGDQLATFHLKRLLNGATGTRIVMEWRAGAELKGSDGYLLPAPSLNDGRFRPRSGNPVSSVSGAPSPTLYVSVGWIL